MELLRFSTAGSVDDGKSTLIGRLLFDSKAIPDDQYEAIKRASNNDDGGVDLALLTDGLRAEREQKITIDVAYRYFATPKRRFIIADTPGHAQYTRNMVTGASTAQAAVILVDARNGLLEQSRRHAALSALLRVPHLAVAVNKMDLVGFDEGVFRAIETEFAAFASKLGVTATAIPLSALAGDNVVERSKNTPYYAGPSLLEWLEGLPVAETRGSEPFRFPVQCVIRPHQNFRGFAGRVVGGVVRPGDAVIALPSGKRSTVKEIVTADGYLAEAHSGESVVLTLTDEVDISRGDLIAMQESPPTTARRFTATVCVLSEAGLAPGRPYIATHTTRQAAAIIEKIDYRLAVENLEKEETRGLALNELGQATITLAQPLLLDPYTQSREMGGFLLLDPATSVPVAAGMVTEILTESDHEAPSEPWTRAERELRHGHRGGVVVVADRAAAAALERELVTRGWYTAFVEQGSTDTLTENGIIAITLGESSQPLETQLDTLLLMEQNQVGFAEGI
ncbi:GTP-binding protein [Armatimonas sp.]|uniref:sulfate adenylyltransferase subunit 1 n=1 Tax=Armatimonas sp. TaxID=1872638 RepID=UPI00286B8F05|nr:GTP-binding protein [Armatimonas sp.]